VSGDDSRYFKKNFYFTDDDEDDDKPVFSIGQDWGFNGIKGTSATVLANFGLKLIQTANCCACRVSILDDKSYGIVVKVLAGGMVDLFGGQDAPELEEMTICGVYEIEIVGSAIHHVHKFTGVDLYTWNENSYIRYLWLDGPSTYPS
jgi:hypothetical protein